MPKGAENRLKYVIVWISGLSDVPTDQLDGKTPLEAADIPCMDSVSRRGRIGLVETMTELVTKLEGELERLGLVNS